MSSEPPAEPTPAGWSIEIAWAADGQIHRHVLTVRPGTRVGEAIETARLQVALPPAHTVSVSVYGRLRGPDHLLAEGDRIELTGALLVDPKVARERRVAHRRAAETRSRWRPQGR